MEALTDLIGIELSILLPLVAVIIAVTNAIKKWLKIKGWYCIVPTAVLSGLIAFKLAPDWCSIIMSTIILSALSSGAWETVKLAAHKTNGGTS